MHALDCALKDRPSLSEWDLVSGLLYQFHSQGIAEGEEPPPEGAQALHAANEFEQALEPGILSPPQNFTAYFENSRDAVRAQRAIEPVLKYLSPRFEISEVEEKNYAEIWKENFHPMAIKPFWLVRATWHDAAKGRDTKEIIIEPGMAFGTGSHETTRACLELMAEACEGHKLGAASRVLDFGCGSGILAIGLKKLGVGTVYAIDIDPLALEATRQNAERNQVDLITGLQAPQYEGLDGIVANILKNTLLEFTPSLRRWLKPGGFLILSGLLLEQEQEILGAYEAEGFRVEKKIVKAEWVSLQLVLSSTLR